jgi:Protein of unknown function (DUF3667)
VSTVSTSSATPPATAVSGDSTGAGGRACANCGTTLIGPYCHGCGQPTHASARSLGALFEDAWHTFAHVDTRVWRTLGLLLARPGELTIAFFSDRRARYLPPFRLYLVLSVLFFATAGLVGADGPANLPTAQKLTKPSDEGSIATLGEGVRLNDGTRGFDPALCSRIHSDAGSRVENYGRRVCERASVDGGAAILRVLKGNIPRMMFVFLPLMALVMRLTYWRPQRYYVEHLVFFLHTHSAFFLVFTVRNLLELPIGKLPAVGWSPAIGIPIAFYVAWYVYRAMRTYYQQSRWLTWCKYAGLVFAYAICLVLTLLATVALSIAEAG